MDATPSLFQAEGSLVEIEGNKPMRLDGSEAAWLVQAGKVDVFAASAEEDRVEGARHHILRVEAGEALFAPARASGEGSIGLVMSGTIGAKLLSIPMARLKELAAEGGAGAAEIADRLDGWIASICRGARVEPFPKQIDTELHAGKRALRKPGKNCRPAKGVCWVLQAEGESFFLGREALGSIGNELHFPVSDQSWLQGPEKGQMKVLGTLDWLREDAAWAGLEHFHRTLLAAVQMNIGLAVESGKRRFEKRKETDRQFVRGALSRLTGVINPELVSVEAEIGDPALAACTAVGSMMGIKIVAHAGPNRDPAEPYAVDEIIRSSNIRVRQVALQGPWWTQDNGPLLGYLNEERRPVALLPISPRRYVLYDPSTGGRTPITEPVARTLNPFAQMFYRGLPSRPANGWDLAKFGSKGIGRDLASVVMLGAAGGFLGIVMPLATGALFDQIIPAARLGALGQIVLALVSATFAISVFNVVRSVATLRMEGRVDQSLQSAVWDRLLALPVSFFRNFTAGDLAARAMGVNLIRQKLSGAAITSVLSGVFSSFSFFLLFYYSPTLALVSTGLIVFAAGFVAAGSFFQVRYQRSLMALEGTIQGFVLEFLTGISKFRIAGAEGRAFAYWAKNFSEQKRIANSAGTIGNAMAVFNAMFPVAGSIVLFFAAQRLSSGAGSLKTGEFLAFNAAYAQFLAAMLALSATVVSTVEVFPLYERSRPILESVPEADEGKSICGDLQGDIEVSHVVFNYTEDGPRILDDVSLHIRPGEFAALIGPSGSGKSTLLRLLLGFEKPAAGSIYYDGQDMAGLDIRSVRQNIGVVLQSAQIMAGSIYENIIGTSKLTMDDAWEAARMAGLDKDIDAMPMGLHTVISQGGGTLSGGQRQRLLIARAVASKPRLLFFDEATSALDNKTQAIVSHSLERLKTTRVVIAHRLSTILNADRIFVMKAGKLIETGTYEELMRAGGLFADLAKRQIA